MTTRTLVGTYGAGYDLMPHYSRVVIERSAYVGGVGLVAVAVATVANHGRVVSGPRAKGGGAGYAGVGLIAGGTVANDRMVSGGRGGHAGVVGGAGGAGGIGIDIAAAGGVYNTGRVRGGGGGGGGPASRTELSGAGGAGGAGVDFAGYGAVVNSGSITGGAGRSGKSVPRSFHMYGEGAGAGGAGGVAVRFGAGGAVLNTGQLTGGAGGRGGHYYYGLGAGGVGGAAVDGSGVGAVSNGGTIAGGIGGSGGVSHPSGVGGSGVYWTGNVYISNAGQIAGGAGDAGYSSFYGGAPGGAGGAAIWLTSGGTIANTGSLNGGQGGDGGDGAYATHGGIGADGGAGGVGVNLAGGAGMVNDGTIVGGAGGGGGGDHYYGTGFGQGGPGGAGIALLAPATIVNDGLIVGGAGGQLYGPGGSGGAGVYIRSTQADLINLGSIIGGIGGSGYRGTYRYRAGIEGDGVSIILSSASIVNGDAGVHTALISGYIGVATANPVDVTVINYGTIEGGESSVELGSTSDRLIAEAGSTLVGTAFGARGTLELAGGDGTISGLGSTGTSSGSVAMTFTGFGVYQIDAGADWTLSGSNILSEAQDLVVAGSLDTVGSLANAGALTVSSGHIVIEGTISGSGVAVVDGGVLDAEAAFTQNVSFSGPAGTLALGESQGYAGAISGFSAEDSFDLRDIAYVDADEATFSGTSGSGVLTVTDGAHSARLTLDGDYLGWTFKASRNGSGGVTVVGKAPHQGVLSPGALIEAMAGLAGPVAAMTAPGPLFHTAEISLAVPHVAWF